MPVAGGVALHGQVHHNKSYGDQNPKWCRHCSAAEWKTVWGGNQSFFWQSGNDQGSDWYTKEWGGNSQIIWYGQG